MIKLIKDEVATGLVFHIRSGNTIVPLVGSKVLFNLIAKATGLSVGGGECEVLDETLGIAKYAWKEGELSLLGEFKGVPTVELAQGASREGIPIDFEVIEKP